MQVQSSAQAALRIRRYKLSEERPKHYSSSLEAREEVTGHVLATVHVIGKATTSPMEVFDGTGLRWQVTPNRKVMPTRWAVADPDGVVQRQFDLRLAGKVINPAQRTSMAVLDASGEEIARLMDARDSAVARLMGLGPDRWVLEHRDELLARVVTLRADTPRRTGLLGKLAELVAPTDRGWVVVADEDPLPAPALLVLLALHDEITAPT